MHLLIEMFYIIIFMLIRFFNDGIVSFLYDVPREYQFYWIYIERIVD